MTVADGAEGPRAAPSESTPEIERLKAELESVHEAWRQSIDSGNAGWKALSAAEQRAEAAEKEAFDVARERLEERAARESNWDSLKATLRAVEQRNTELEGALRKARAELVLDGHYEDMGVISNIDAALHDEERSAPPQEGERDR